MMKHKWSHLVAALLTLAMAFSLLAVPASAASVSEEEASKAQAIVSSVTYPTANQSFYRVIETKASYTGGNWSAHVQLRCAGLSTIYEGNVPSSAYRGYLHIVDGQGSDVIWLTQEECAELDAALKNGASMSIDWNKGTITAGDTVLGGSSVEISGDTALLIVGGIVVAAGVATAVYFYTHPKAWQEVTNRVQGAWNSLIGA
jgi:hypothetical protein